MNLSDPSADTRQGGVSSASAPPKGLTTPRRRPPDAHLSADTPSPSAQAQPDPYRAIVRSATVYRLIRDDHDRATWEPIDDFAIGRHRPVVALSIWIAERSPEPGSYRLDTSDGATASVWIDGREAA